MRRRGNVVPPNTKYTGRKRKDRFWSYVAFASDSCMIPGHIYWWALGIASCSGPEGCSTCTQSSFLQIHNISLWSQICWSLGGYFYEQIMVGWIIIIVWDPEPYCIRFFLCFWVTDVIKSVIFLKYFCIRWTKSTFGNLDALDVRVLIVEYN